MNSEYFLFLGAEQRDQRFAYSSLTWNQNTNWIQMSEKIPNQNNTKTNLLRKQTVHDKKQDSLKAAKNCEQIRHGYRVLLKLETPKDPHNAQNAQLSHCSNDKCPAGGNKCTQIIWMKFKHILCKNIFVNKANKMKVKCPHSTTPYRKMWLYS